jgi:hypothetical protein
MAVSSIVHAFSLHSVGLFLLEHSKHIKELRDKLTVSDGKDLHLDFLKCVFVSYGLNALVTRWANERPLSVYCIAVFSEKNTSTPTYRLLRLVLEGRPNPPKFYEEFLKLICDGGQFDLARFLFRTDPTAQRIVDCENGFSTADGCIIELMIKMGADVQRS